ncbi:serine/threonine-protein kinase [[Limnothrix rosea] IAM M-220]|uniref:serine/threonine-protein kinase n=1 Tax=[Limnothrix rosea] IAM M-220 TaxID=454133 RepID=UPI00095CF966|nr:serine/threonine-protein kinase [[Limnothrix rosea] IAM M-220]OKH17061.1 serine/threonine protein kinase [[Limnothrix rosea] IAM M-220]
MTLPIGQTLNGRYRITQELARGGFGATFLAEDLYLPEHPHCVVKQLKPQVDDPQSLKTARRLFETEAQILHELGKHEQIPQLFAYFEESQEFYLVQDYIEGQSLRDEIRQQGKLSQGQVIAILREILELLVFVHGNQVIHRDLNPSNLIRRTGDRRLCLIDFGAVKRVTTQFQQATGRATVAIGTQGYIPSEQAQGRPQFGSDIYAAGMIAIEALTGQFPHTLGTDPRTAELIWRDLVDIDKSFADVIDKMVRHDFRERYFSAEAVLAALDGMTAPQTSNTVVLGKAAPLTEEVSTEAIATSSFYTQVPQSSDLTFGLNPKDRGAIAVVIGLGVAAVVGVGVSLNLGWQWWSGRQATLEQFEQGQLYQELGEPENALTSYQDVLDQNAQHRGALLGKAQILQQLQRYDEALATYDQLLQVDPNAWEAWWGRGKILSDRQQYDQAIASLNKAIQINSNSLEIWQAKAQIHLAQDDQTNALSSLEIILKLDSRQAWAWYEKGWIHHKREEYNEAIAAYDRALRINNADPNIWYQKGNSYFKLANYQESKNAYARVVRLKPDHAPAWYSLGISHENLKQYRDAQDAFAKVIELEPSNDRAWYHLAWNAQRADDKSTAIAAYRRTVELKGNDHTSWLNLANLLYESKDYPQAISAYDRALGLKPQDGDSWELKGNAHLTLDQYAEAIAAYDQALQYKPEDENIRANREQAQKELDRRNIREKIQEEVQEGLEETVEDIEAGLGRLFPWL